MFLKQGIPKARRQSLLRALDFVVGARIIFESAKPYDPGHGHFVVVRLEDLLAELSKEDSLSKIRLKVSDIEKVRSKLESLTYVPPESTRRTWRMHAVHELLRIETMRSIDEDASVDVSAALRSSMEANKPGLPSGLDDQSPLSAVREMFSDMFKNWVESRDKENATEVSFSMFIFALQSSCLPHCHSDATSYRVISSLKEHDEEAGDYSEYLN